MNGATFTDGVELDPRQLIKARSLALAANATDRDMAQVSAEVRRLESCGRAPTPAELSGLARLLQSMAKSGEDAQPFSALDAVAIAEPLPAVHALIPSLDIGSGAPALIAGYGFAGKTMAAQSAGLSVAAGRALWGTRSIARRGPFVHLDYEQGERLTRERYQRLARGMGVDLAGLGADLRLVSLPRMRLTDPHAEDALVRLLDGVALCLVDSLRAAAPDLDENSSEVRRVLDSLGAVSDRTKCAFIVIHHARKPSVDGHHGGARMAIRGSGAIYDACSSVFVFGAEKGEPTTVQHEKARGSGVCADDFLLSIVDVEGVDAKGEPDQRWGLRVVESGTDETPHDPVAELRRLVLRAIAPGDLTSADLIATRCGKRKAAVVPVLRALESEGAVFQDVKGGTYRVR